jgi:DNA-binding NtrC family response regulator
MEQADDILVVDDDWGIREMIAAYLRKNGLRASMVADGRKMRAVLDVSPMGLIVLDGPLLRSIYPACGTREVSHVNLSFTPNARY